jgi:hypothetical protein
MFVCGQRKPQRPQRPQRTLREIKKLPRGSFKIFVGEGINTS